MPNNIISWYNSQYRVWDRTRRLQMAPFLAQAEQSGGTTTQPPGSVAIDMSSTESKEKESRSESLFGPPIPPDAVQDSHSQPTQPQDEVHQAVVDEWVDRNKQGDEPATTLQALVNLKRPSLRLSPLASNASNTDLGSNAKASHGLEFDYDCDAAKCRITVTMIPNEHIESESERKNEPITIFEAVTDGGFGRTLKHEHGAILDLAHDETKETDVLAPEDAPASEQVTLPAEPPAAATRSRRRISVPFHIRRRDRGPQQATGPALPVVDADAHNATAAESSKDNTPKETGGVDVTIQLDALDEAGVSVSPRNSQLTLLHIVKMGQPPSDGSEDTRSWVVRVVRRDALIGNHIFRLQEIYGLASANAPAPAPQTYPPAPTDHDGEALPDAHTQQQTYEFAGAECVLCLSSPREVMLLPCRHLVACKECAENMITFGAGEGVSAPAAPVAEETTTPANNANQTSDGAPNTNTTSEPLTPFQAAATAGRRKRKAKGWFCPVCRQPYTSLLRISTQPLNVKSEITASSTEQAQQPAGENEQQMQSKGPLSGMVSMARGVLTRKQTADVAPVVSSAEPTATTEQSVTTNTSSAANNA